jgi:adenylate kinase family enzyme
MAAFDRALVIGFPGAGKSTFARALGRVTGVPVVHLDQLYWKAGWVASSEAEFAARHDDALARPRWIIDGGYVGSLERRLQRAEIVFWLDRPRGTCIARVLRRVAASHGSVRPDLAAGCPERLDLGFLRYTWMFRGKFNSRIEAALGRHRHVRVLKLCSDRAAQDYLARLAL